MRYLGIDYGTKRIGLAVSSEGIAFPHGVLENDRHVVLSLKETVNKERIEKIIIGDTRTFGGHENQITKEVEMFTEKIRNEIGIPVVLANEAGSSIEASRYAPGEEKHDDAAAAVILQRYLDMHGSATL